MTSRFPPFAFVELVSPYNKKNITRWLKNMNFMFSWQEHKIHIFSPPYNILYIRTLTHELIVKLKEWHERPWTYVCECSRKAKKVGSTATVPGTVY